MAQPFFSGVTTDGINPTLLSNIQKAVIAAGGTGVVITSGKRPPGLAHNDVKNSNHITGNAIDGYAIIGGKQVPLGQALLSNAGDFGLRSGDVAGFDPRTPGGYDPIHVDDGANVGGVQPAAQTTSAQTTGNVGNVSLLKQLLANYPKLDPRAVLAISGHEGLSGGIGDGGHAFGPFQLNNAGGVITGMFPNSTPDQINQWAWSRAGLNFALGRINDVAGGLTGKAAVTAIASRFERPADVQGEITDAWNNYGSTPTGGSNPTLAGSPGGSQSLTGGTPQATLLSAQIQPQSQQIATQQLQSHGTNLALQLLDSAQNMLSGGSGNLSQLFAAGKNFQAATKAAKPALGGSALQVKAGGLTY